MALAAPALSEKNHPMNISGKNTGHIINQIAAGIYMEANTRKNKAPLGALLFLISSVTFGEDRNCTETNPNIFSGITKLFARSEPNPKCMAHIITTEYNKADKSYENENWTDDLYRTSYQSNRDTRLSSLQQSLNGNISSFTIGSDNPTSIVEDDLQTLKGYNTIK